MAKMEMRDATGAILDVGDYVLVQPPNNREDEAGLLMARARPGIEMKIPATVGRVIGRIHSVIVVDDEGIRIPGMIKVGFMARATGSLRVESVKDSECKLILRSDGSDV